MISDILKYLIPKSKGRDVSIKIITDVTESVEVSVNSIDLRGQSKETRVRVKAIRAITKMLNYKSRVEKQKKRIAQEVIDVEVV